MTTDKYILNDKGEPVVEPDLMKWARWFETGKDRIVERTQIGNIKVSTVFLGFDHNYSATGGPVLWETMVFGGPLDQEQTRCSGNREQAMAMHQKMIEAVKRNETRTQP